MTFSARSTFLLAALAASCGGPPSPAASSGPVADAQRVEPTSDQPAGAEKDPTASLVPVAGVLPEKAAPRPAPTSRDPGAAMRDVPPVVTPPISDATSGPVRPELEKARDHLALERLPEAKKEIEAVLASAGSSRDIKLQALAFRGRLYRAAKNAKLSDEAYDAIVAARADAEAWAAAQMTAGDVTRSAIVLQALGEALFVVAERDRKKSDAIVRPIPRGNLDRDATMKFVNTEIKQWLMDKRQAIEATEKAYVEILNIKPQPPPGWIVAAGSRTAGMWASFVIDFRSVPAPKEWSQKGMVPRTDMPYTELLDTYRRALFDASEPQLEQARSAYRSCQGYADRFQVDDPFSRGCTEWLRLDGAP